MVLKRHKSMTRQDLIGMDLVARDLLYEVEMDLVKS